MVADLVRPARPAIQRHRLFADGGKAGAFYMVQLATQLRRAVSYVRLAWC